MQPAEHACGSLHLGILIPEFPSQTHTFFWREICALRAQGCTVSLLSTRRPPPNACPHEFAEPARQQTSYLWPPPWLRATLQLARHPLRTARAMGYLMGLEETPWRRRLLLLSLLWAAAGLVLLARRRGIQHVHVHSCADAAHLVALAHWLGGPRYSLFLHGDLPVYGTDHRHKMRRAAFVMTAGSHLVAQVATVAQVPAARIVPTCMGVDTKAFSAVAGTRDQGPLQVLTVARLNRTKGHLHALAAVQACRRAGIAIAYHVVGAGDFEPEIRAAIAALGLADCVVLHGGLGEDRVRARLAAADVFLLASTGLGEAAPVAVMEAMACGLPVVCSIIGSTPDMLRDGEEGYLVPQADEAALARALTALARDPARRAAMGRQARLRAETQFDAGLLARQLAALCQAPPG